MRLALVSGEAEDEAELAAEVAGEPPGLGVAGCGLQADSATTAARVTAMR